MNFILLMVILVEVILAATIFWSLVARDYVWLLVSGLVLTMNTWTLMNMAKVFAEALPM